MMALRDSSLSPSRAMTALIAVSSCSTEIVPPADTTGMGESAATVPAARSRADASIVMPDLNRARDSIHTSITVYRFLSKKISVAAIGRGVPDGRNSGSAAPRAAVH